ncbi:MAG: hypothetical protein IK100_01360 [Muribaculaceae bacterium]|nr:hypothetical protein [Muribaculaceae bacterium]
MRKLFLLAIALCAFFAVNATSRSDKDKDAEIEAVMADAKLKFKQGGDHVFNPESCSYCDINWRNGAYGCNVVIIGVDNNSEDHLGFMLEESKDWDERYSSSHFYEVELVKGKPTVTNQKGVTVEHKLAGRWHILVFRDAKNNVLDVALRKMSSDYYEETLADMRDMINGVYVGTGKNASDTVVFGAVYGEGHSRLPGADYDINYPLLKGGMPISDLSLQVAYCPERMKRVHMPEPSKKMDENGVMHYYADGKEISREEYEHLSNRPDGYKGHGSLHGPLWWKVRPQGNDLAVELECPFDEDLDAFYSNFRDDYFTLKWVRSPYKGMKDRWAVLSMRPVTRGMLVFFDKATLQQMLKYLNGRKKPTDIEKLNKSLINTMLRE